RARPVSCILSLHDALPTLHDSVQRLVEAAFETLTGAGVAPEVAYLTCLHELKERIDLVWAGGFAAEHGPDGGARRTDAGVIDATVRERLGQVWQRVHSGDGATAAELTREAVRASVPDSRRAAAEEAHPLEQVGRRVRSLMSWLR